MTSIVDVGEDLISRQGAATRRANSFRTALLAPFISFPPVLTVKVSRVIQLALQPSRIQYVFYVREATLLTCTDRPVSQR